MSPSAVLQVSLACFVWSLVKSSMWNRYSLQYCCQTLLSMCFCDWCGLVENIVLHNKICFCCCKVINYAIGDRSPCMIMIVRREKNVSFFSFVQHANTHLKRHFAKTDYVKCDINYAAFWNKKIMVLNTRFMTKTPSSPITH